MSDFEKVKKEFPSKERFYSSFTGKKINCNEFEHILKVWNTFQMKALKDYHDVHLKCHILKLRKSSLKSYGLCPNHYLSMPALSWDAMLNMTKVELELISDANMYFFFEKGMRGGVSYISKRYSKANSTYLKSYEPKQESKHIIFLDANNFYSYVMFKLLPTINFKWIDPKNFD